jgi:hypothetical protein
MAVRVVALLIPLAITLPQLRLSRPDAPAVQSVAAEAPALSYENRQVSEAATLHAAHELPTQMSASTLQSSSRVTADSAAAAGVATQVHKASPRRTTPKLIRGAAPGKPTRTAAKPTGQATRRADRLQADAGCLPNVPCAPVVVAKVTPVVRRPL